VKASERCGFCHVKDEQPLEAVQDTEGAGEAKAAAGPTADTGLE